MILWLFAFFDLFIGFILLGSHFDFLPWRFTLFGAVALAFKAIVFNDKFLSFLDILAAIYLFLLIFMNGSFITWIFGAYFSYKVVMSLF